MPLPCKMSGVVLTGHGGPEKLEWRDDLPVPTPGARDVVVKVSAAGVNNTDINTRTAWYSKGDGESDDASWSGKALSFPRIQGADVCGHIVAVGDQVDAARVGERVLIEPCIREATARFWKRPGILVPNAMVALLSTRGSRRDMPIGSKATLPISNWLPSPAPIRRPKTC